MPLRIRRSYIAAFHDSVMAAISFVLALYLRLGSSEFYKAEPYVLEGTIIFTIISTALLLSFHVYKRVWLYTSLQDLVAITKAVTLSILIFLPIMFLYNRLEGMPRSLMFINWFVFLALIGGPRFLYRILKDRNITIDLNEIPDNQKIPVLLIGANDRTELFLRETVGNRYSDYKIVGILDNDKNKIGHYIRNIKIYDNINGFEKVVEKLKSKGRAPQKVLIAPDILEGTEIRGLLEKADELGLTISRLPRITDFRQTSTDKIEMRPIAVEDLLGRPQKTMDREIMNSFISGKRVLITGAGGTIGGELVRQIASYDPAHITLFENSEHNLYLIDKELEEKFSAIEKSPVIGDVRDKKNVEIIFKQEKPDIVFHAAALKHVPMSEINPCEAALTNIIGTKNVADTCLEQNIEEMVMISTDKAVNPTNIMGATKKIAESYIQALGQSKKAKKKGATKFVTIRFGNVLGSTGSVIPLFKRQISEGGPVTVTHPEVTRYFMTVREAVELVILASATVTREESQEGRIFVLDMQEPILIKDLAEQMIRLAGLRPNIDIKIEFTGLRLGEKLFEELFHSEEAPVRTEHEGILIAASREVDLSYLDKIIKKTMPLISNRDSEKTIGAIKGLLPEYNSTEDEQAA